jgi:large subunit ribosomal protein L21
VSKCIGLYRGDGICYNLLVSEISCKERSMKKAVIATGGKQYVVVEGETLTVERLKDVEKSVRFDALLVIDGDKISVGAPFVAGMSVTATVVDADARAPKVTSIRYKAKKRVHKLHGHRQSQTVLKIEAIA